MLGHAGFTCTSSFMNVALFYISVDEAAIQVRSLIHRYYRLYNRSYVVYS